MAILNCLSWPAAFVCLHRVDPVNKATKLPQGLNLCRVRRTDGLGLVLADMPSDPRFEGQTRILASQPAFSC